MIILFSIHGVVLLLHICIHVIGIHTFFVTQVRERNTFLKIGESLMARHDLDMERQLKQLMIESVMPKKVCVFVFCLKHNLCIENRQAKRKERHFCISTQNQNSFFSDRWPIR